MRIITNADLLMFLEWQGVTPANKLVGDEKYVLPARDWVNVQFASAFEKLLWTLNVNEWAPERNDCDNFARGAAWFASTLNARTASAPDAELCFGEFWYVRADGRGGHAINFFVTSTVPNSVELGTLQLAFWEPQTRSEVTLTPQEIISCNAYRI